MSEINESQQGPPGLSLPSPLGGLRMPGPSIAPNAIQPPTYTPVQNPREAPETLRAPIPLARISETAEPGKEDGRIEDFQWNTDAPSIPLPSVMVKPPASPLTSPSIVVTPPPNLSMAPKLESPTAEIQFRQADAADSLEIDTLLLKMLDGKGSDLHLSAKAFPMMRIHGDITPIPGYSKLSGNQIDKAIRQLMTVTQRNRFENDMELDFAYDLAGKSRFRVNVMKQRGETSVVMRTIPWEIKTVEQLGLPTVITQWAKLPRGLVLITGPTGSGKSTTLAAIIDYANRTRASHIVTIEDPIEFVHDHHRSVINQREVGADTASFQAALKHVLRQDPDIILIGELRDLETIQVALTAAETGHLVFATLHTQSAAETISRIIDVFPAGEKASIQTQLGATIQGIACQTLLKTIDGEGRVAAVEILVGTDSVRAQIREGKISQIPSSLQTGGSLGMQTLDAVLSEYVKTGIVDWREAADKSTNRKEFLSDLGGEAELEKLAKRLSAQKRQGL